MSRRRKILLAIAGAFVLPIVAVVLYFAFSDLSGWRDTVARFASKGVDRELTIAGEFEVDLGIVTKVHATEISLANTGWGSEPRMASMSGLTILTASQRKSSVSRKIWQKKSRAYYKPRWTRRR